MTDEEMRLTRLVADQGAQIARLTNNERVHKLVLEQIKHDLKQERAAVVAYLRDCAHRDAYRNHNRNRAEALWDAANIVESGEHRREEEK